MAESPLRIEAIPGFFAVSRVQDASDINWEAPYTFAGKTDSEFSLVCREAEVPEAAHPVSRGWRLFRVAGSLDFSLTGILARISGVLAAKSIPIFAVSTYGTDYVLVKNRFFTAALRVLEEAGFAVRR